MKQYGITLIDRNGVSYTNSYPDEKTTVDLYGLIGKTLRPGESIKYWVKEGDVYETIRYLVKKGSVA